MLYFCLFDILCNLIVIFSAVSGFIYFFTFLIQCSFFISGRPRPMRSGTARCGPARLIVTSPKPAT